MIAREKREPTGIATAERSGDPPGNLPTQITTFVGRERPIAEVTWLLNTAPLLSLLSCDCARSYKRLSKQPASADPYDGVSTEGKMKSHRRR